MAIPYFLQPILQKDQHIFGLFIFVLILKLNECHLPDPPVFSTVQHYPSICYLPPDSGLCKTTVSHEDIGNNNDPEQGYPLFASQASDRKRRENQLITRYYFDVATEQCYPFGAQNCGGNENRFESLVECQTRCRLTKEQP
uniref:BPTI/Kunitz inhibitor domain-containing protein n=1 Tax=Ditylenchus dipsaci TaxID=166011 RepID=A0A915CMA7_9BILA